METIKIRELRADVLKRYCAKEQLVGITNNRVLAAVLVPVGQSWVDHIVEMNWSRISQSVSEGAVDRAGERPLISLAETLRVADAAESPVEEQHEESGRPFSDSISPLLVVRKMTNALAQITRQGGSSLRWDTPVAPTRTVRLGELSGATIEAAATAGELLAVTTDRVLMAFLIPVTDELVTHLVETNVSRVMLNVLRGEQERDSGSPFVTLDQALTSSASAVRSPTEVARRASEHIVADSAASSWDAS